MTHASCSGPQMNLRTHIDAAWSSAAPYLGARRVSAWLLRLGQRVAERGRRPTPAAAGAGSDAAAPTVATVLQRALAQQHSQPLHPDIARRFDQHAMIFAGTMQQVCCSLPGALLALLLRPLHLLPARCARDVAFVFRIEARGAAFHKERLYRFADGGTFVFRSLFAADPCLHEQFPLGLGMALRLEAQQDGALLFADDGYFVQVMGRRWRLPAWLGARFELLHKSIDADRFQVLLRVSHPLFGTLFYQRGEFAPP
ncbi:MAG: DUF4166 domain-containing protein [Betaproteobacteria bacterium]